MMLFALILSFVIAGSLACSDDHCKNRELANELVAVRFLPNREKLTTLCPTILTFLNCEKEYFECHGQSLEELASSSDEIEASEANAMLSGISLVRELCDTDSSLHNGYVESADCFRSHIDGAGRMCQQELAMPIEAFFEGLSEESISEEAYNEIRCLRDALGLACVIDNLGDSCGNGALETAKTVLQRMKPALKGRVCAGVENAADLKSRFLDFLELEDEKRDRVQGILDLIKRRR